MTDRSDRIRLPANESRCEPGRPCSVRSRCARAQATIPKGTPLEDFTTGDNLRQQDGGTAKCPGLLLLADLHADAPPPRQVKPAVKGLS